uniref:CSON003595 protein n=1 Tax=Culicoides sonorensis TaxID=179676 RepID=A0A336LD10_CULSO
MIMIIIIFYSELVLKQEQEEYNREGIAWTHIDYFNNQIICDLVEQPHKGIISIMDEACLNVGKITDETLLEAMDKKLSHHKHYTSRQLKPMDKELKHKEHFRITHYAGDVIYSINGFIEKNRDQLYQDFKRLLFNSRNSILQEMWPEGAQDISKTTKRPLTAGTLFQKSMAELVATLLRKVRGFLARQKYKKMKAALIIMRYYRQYKLRSYVQYLADNFRHAKQMRDYGKSIQWPTPPLAGRFAEQQLRMLFSRWRAAQILRKYPRSEWPQLRLQIITASALKRRRRFWGQERKWTGNYLANTHENSNYNSYNTSINNLKNSNAFKCVFFSSFVKKFNHQNKSADRAIIVTETGIYKLDSAKNKFKTMKRSISIKEMTGISVSPGRDQLIVFHSANNNDLVVALQGENQPLKEDRVGEILAHVCKKYMDLCDRELSVNVTTAIKTYLGKKSRTISIEGVAGCEQPTFKHAGSVIVYEVPAAYCSAI